MGEILTDLSTEALTKANEANLYASTPFLYNLPGAETYKGEDISWCISGIPLLPCNIVFHARLQPERVDNTIESLVEKARNRNVSLRWNTEKDTQPADLGERLEAHGFTTFGPVPLMAIDLNTMKQDVTLPPGLTIKEVTEEADFEIWYHIVAQCFGIPPEREPYLSEWFSITRNIGLPMRYYMAFLGGTPVATSQLFPAGISRDSIYDAFACRKTAQEFEKARKGISENICGMCIAACPWTKQYIGRI